jgi:hypothetical protein
VTACSHASSVKPVSDLKPGGNRSAGQGRTRGAKDSDNAGAYRRPRRSHVGRLDGWAPVYEHVKKTDTAFGDTLGRRLHASEQVPIENLLALRSCRCGDHGDASKYLRDGVGGPR